MKIAIDISQIIYGTGVSVYTKSLCESLVKNFPDDQYLFFGGSLRRQKELRDFAKKLKQSSKIVPFSPTMLDFLWNSLHLFPIDKFIGKCDLVHTSDWTEPPSAFPKVTTIHDLVPFMYPETSHPSIRSAHRKRMAWVIRESKAIIAVSQSTKNDLINLFNIKSEKIVVIPEGVEARFSPQPISVVDTIKRRFGIQNDFIFSVSTLEPRKNYKKLIEAFQIVQKDFPDLELVVAGKVGWGEEIKPVPGVKMLGFISDDEKIALYSGALCYVAPSLYEGFGLTPLEAMACGCPVAVSANSSFPEVVGEAGIMINPESAKDIATGIIKAIKGGGNLRRLGIEQSKEFSWDKTAKETHRLYELICQGSF